MPSEGIACFIIDYIASRRQPKLEAFDKEAKKKLAALTGAEEIAATRQALTEQRRELEKRYEVVNWLSDAANRVWQIKFATHAPKFTHGDSKSSGILYVEQQTENSTYLSSSSLSNPAIDVIGNAAVLDVAKMLQYDVNGKSLISCLANGDNSPLTAFTDDVELINDWVSKFMSVMHSQQPSSHKLAKQLYFPVGENGYHLLGPLFSSSLAQAMHQRITEARFGEAAKEIYSAFKAGAWHPEPRVSYPNTAVQKIGGANPQGISYLNSVRGGRIWLLSCAAPNWQNFAKPPKKHKSIFHKYSEFSIRAWNTVWQMREYLRSVKSLSNSVEIRERRLAYTEEIIDTLFGYAAEIQNLDIEAGWSAASDCQLKRSQQLWLDRGRAVKDQDFRFEREGKEWQKELALDFGVWFNRRLQHDELKMGEVERREWSTASLFKQRLREFEQGLTEDLL